MFTFEASIILRKENKHETEKLIIVSISSDTEKIWKEGLDKQQLPWVNLNDFLGLEGYASFCGVRGIPFYVLISPDGTIEKMWSGYGKDSLKEKWFYKF